MRLYYLEINVSKFEIPYSLLAVRPVANAHGNILSPKFFRLCLLPRIVFDRCIGHNPSKS